MLGEYPVLTDATSLNEPITIDEVRFALTTAKKGKAVGEDEIPMEVLQNKAWASPGFGRGGAKNFYFSDL